LNTRKITGTHQQLALKTLILTLSSETFNIPIFSRLDHMDYQMSLIAEIQEQATFVIKKKP